MARPESFSGNEPTEFEVKVDPKRLEKDRKVKNLYARTYYFSNVDYLGITYQVLSIPHRTYMKHKFYSFKME